MSDSSQQNSASLPPLNIAGPPPARQRRPWSVGEIISWVVIVLSVAVVIIVPKVTGDHSSAKTEEDRTPGIKILLSGRTVVGIYSEPLPKDPEQARTFQKLRDESAKAMDESARSPADKFRAAIVHGEIEGQAAIAEIDRLVAQYPSLAADAATLKGVYAGEVARDSPKWRDFAQREGWFADLAASQSKPREDPLRKATIGAAQRTVMASAGGVVVALAAAFVGLVLLIIALILFSRKKLAPAFDRARKLPADRRAYVQGFALYLGFYVAGGLLIKLVLHLLPGTPGVRLWAVLALPIAFAIGLFWPVMRGQSWKQWRMALGLHTGTGFFRELLAGAVGYITGLPLLAVGVLLAAVLTKVSGVDASHPIAQEMTGGFWEIVLIFLLASVFAPITEELMFRGALFAHLRERLGFGMSAIGVSIVFIIIHPQAWPALPPLACIALILAFIREWRGSILGCMMAHAINNTAVMLMLVLALS